MPRAIGMANPTPDGHAFWVRRAMRHVRIINTLFRCGPFRPRCGNDFKNARRGPVVDLRNKIAGHPDFPKPGILFRDFAPALRDPAALTYMADEVERRFPAGDIDVVAGIESRGFILGTLMAVRYNRGLVMIRKAGKTPGETRSVSYDLEYGSATIETRDDAIEKGARVLICDDLLATGGTAAAAAELVEAAEAEVVGMAFIIELKGLEGRGKIGRYRIESLVEY